MKSWKCPACKRENVTPNDIITSLCRCGECMKDCGEFKMPCQNCKKSFPEKEIEESHNVPLYLFQGLTRKERKSEADRLGRKNICKECHDSYEAQILKILYRNLLGKDLELIQDRLERKKHFPRIWRLDKEIKQRGIKICLKMNMEVSDNVKQ